MTELAIITGGSKGIGEALVEVAHEAGAVTATMSRTPLSGHHLSVDLGDVSEWPQAIRWIDDAVADHMQGPVWLFHMAGALEPIGFAGEVDAGDYQRLVLLNAAVPQLLGAGFIRSMERHGRKGGLILASSGAASTPYAGWSAYCAGKAAVDQWTRVVGAEQLNRGRAVQVLAVAPGLVETGMQEKIRSTSEQEFPEVGKFQNRHRTGAVMSREWAARRIWNVAHSRISENGAVLDLRYLADE